MNKGQRIISFLTGLFILGIAAIMFLDPESGYIFAGLFISLSLLSMGVRSLAFYVFMARHMVGGKAMLYFGVLMLDFGMFTATLIQLSSFYLMLYLVGTHAFTSAITIMRGIEARKMESPSWMVTLTEGLVNAMIAVLCIIFLHTPEVLGIMYCLGMVYNGVMRIIAAFRKTEIVFIQ